MKEMKQNNSDDFGFFTFSGTLKSIWECKERLFRLFMRTWSKNSKTTPNYVKNVIFAFLTFADLEQSKNIVLQ